MVSLQEDVKLDCSYKVLAEDKPMLSNYPPKLHRKAEGVESWQHCCPRLKNNKNNREVEKKKKMKITEIIHNSKAETLASRSEFGNYARSFVHADSRGRDVILSPPPPHNLQAKKSNADSACAQQRAIVSCIIHSDLSTVL